MRNGELSGVAQRGLICAIALAGRGLEHAASVVRPDAALAARVAQLEAENAQLRTAMSLKDARMARVPPRNRPHYTAPERMEILAWQAAAGVGAAAVAAMFLVTPQALGNWKRELDGAGTLVKSRRPMNKLPDYLREVTRSLAQLLPQMGRRQVADVLGGFGLEVSAATVARIRRERTVPESPPPEPLAGRRDSGRGVVAKYVNHVWHLDLTFVPLFALVGPWWPWAAWLGWPFGWWVGSVVDQYSRRAVRLEVFARPPTGAQVVGLLGRAIAGGPPRHLISDQGSAMRSRYRAFCRERGIRWRYGAVGRHASIAIIERFWRTLKQEGLRRAGLLPRKLRAMQALVDDFAAWYNEHRPHQGIGGLTPERRAAGEVLPVANAVAAVEVGARVVVVPFRGRAHLPVVELRDAA